MKGATMFWFWVLLATALCAPKIKIGDNSDVHIQDVNKNVNGYDGRDTLEDELVYAAVQTESMHWPLETNRAELIKRDIDNRKERTARSVNTVASKKILGEVANFDGIFKDEHNIKAQEDSMTLINDARTVKTDQETPENDQRHTSVIDTDVEISTGTSSYMGGIFDRDGLEMIETLAGNKDRAFDHLTHKYSPSASSVKLNSFDKESILGFVQNIFTYYQRENTKRTNYDDGRVSTDMQEVKDSDEDHQSLYHRYSNTMTLKDIYLKMGGVCTLIEGFSSRPIYVISSCPRFGSQTNIQYYCELASPYIKRFHQENIIDLIMTPVQDPTGFVYKNVYCAQCNGITSITAWSTKLDCDHFQSVELSDGRQQIRILDQFADKHQGCQRHLTPEVNQMLHECSQREVVSTMKSRNHELRIGEGSKSELSPFPLSYSILMNFGFDGKTHILFTTQPHEHVAYGSHCDDDEIYDQYNNKCRAISCEDGYEFVNGACQKTAHYESDSNPGDLINLEEIDEPFLVTLTIHNVSMFDITTLYILDLNGDLEELFQNILSASFNISKERIQNVTITLFNTSDSTSHLSQEEIEIFILSTPRKGHLTSTRAPVTETVDDLLPLINIYSADDPGELSVDDIDVNSTATDGNSTNHKPMNSTPFYSTSNSNMSVNISFILYKPHRNRTNLEVSTKSVVKSMSDLVESNLFFITINGTNFPIDSIYNVEDVQSMDTFCEFGKVSDYYSMGKQFVVLIEYIPELEMNVTKVYVNETGYEYSPGQYDLTYSVDGVMGMLNETIVESFVFVCNMPDIVDEQCSRIVLTKEEYELIRDETNMSPPVIKFAHHLYNMSQFEWQSIEDKTIRICAPEWNASAARQEASQWAFVCGEDLVKVAIAESYLTFILGLISLVCLMSVLITYGMFEKLRNLPGINTINLTLSLFLGELVFMLSGWVQPHRWLCSAVGVILHFLFLASFFWMNIMSYDVYCTFAKTNTLGRIRSKRKYVYRYSAYAWGCPLIIVGICSIIDFTGLFDNIAIGYGGSMAEPLNNESETKPLANDSISGSTHVYSIGCWIQQPVASMAAFGGPMIFVLFSNTVMFIRTIICIRANKKSTKESIRRSSVRKNVGHDDVMLYVRMSTVMGFTWIFGLASSVVSAFSGTPTGTSCIILHLLGILFIVFNCSQGIFIFFVFVFNRRVLALYRGLHIRHKQDRRKNVSVSTSSGTLHSTISQSSIQNGT